MVVEGHRSRLLGNSLNPRPLNRCSRSAPSKVVQTTDYMLVAECLLGADANMHRAMQVLQRQRAEQEQMFGWMQSVRCFRAVTGIPVLHRRWLGFGQGGCCSAAALGKGNTTRGGCADECHAEGLSVSRGQAL